MSTKYTTGRLEEIDILRGVGILLMVFGHVGFGEGFYRFIHAFHMPLFYFVTGYFFRPREKAPQQYIIGKARRLLVPYALFAVLHLLIWILLNPQSYNRIPELLTNMLLYPNADAFPIAGGLWFLVSLFVTECIVLAAVTVIPNRRVCDAFFAGMLLFGGVCTRILPLALPFTLDSSLAGAAIFYLAFRLKDKWNREMDCTAERPKWVLLLCTLGVAASIMIHETINIRVAWLGTIPVFWWINALAAVFLLWYYARGLTKLQSFWWLRQGLSQIGRDSIVYLCLNQLTILVLRMLFPHAGAILVAVLTMIVLMICSRILNHPNLKRLIGK